MFAAPVTEKSLNSHEFEWRPRHMSLPLVLRRCRPSMLGRWALLEDDDVDVRLALDACRGCGGLADAKVGEVGWRDDVDGRCSGGI